MNNNFTITTPRILLKPAVAGDEADMFALWTEPLVCRFFWDNEPPEQQVATATIAASEQQFQHTGLGQWTAFDRKNDMIIGGAGLLTVENPLYDRDILPQSGDQVELNFAFLPAYRGQGYGTEVVRAMLEYGRQVSTGRAVFALVDIANVASARALEKAGMVRRQSIQIGEYEVVLFDYRL
jgi:ribosomal-protein-alanine N-acetyltransferase